MAVRRARGLWSVPLLSACAALLVGCGGGGVRIEGQLDNLAANSVVVSAIDSLAGWKPVAEATVDNGHFVIEGLDIEAPECLVLGLGAQNLLVFAQPGDDIDLDGNALCPENVHVRGAALNDSLRLFAENVPGQDRLAQIEAHIDATERDVDSMEDLMREAHSIEMEQLAYIRANVTGRTSSPVGLFILLNNLRHFTFEEVEELLGEFRSGLGDHKYVRLLSNTLESHRQLNAARRSAALGATAPDFTLANAQGDTVSLASLRGQMVLLEFWRSDSPDCRRNNAIVVSVAQKFGGKGMVVVGVSLDSDREAWLRAVADDKLPGIQLVDPTGNVARLYGIEMVPYSLILNEDGTIISSEQSAESLFEQFNEQMEACGAERPDATVVQ